MIPEGCLFTTISVGFISTPFVLFSLNGCKFLIFFSLSSRRCVRRTRRWRCWWIRWGTCCGTSTPCWHWGNDSHFFYFSMFFCPFFLKKRVLQRGWRSSSEEENFGFKAWGGSQLCWYFTTGTEPAVELGVLLLGHILEGGHPAAA